MTSNVPSRYDGVLDEKSAEGTPTRDDLQQAKREAQLVLLEAIKEERYNPSGQRSLAEAYALLAGTLTAPSGSIEQ